MRLGRLDIPSTAKDSRGRPALWQRRAGAACRGSPPTGSTKGHSRTMPRLTPSRRSGPLQISAAGLPLSGRGTHTSAACPKRAHAKARRCCCVNRPVRMASRSAWVSGRHSWAIPAHSLAMNSPRFQSAFSFRPSLPPGVRRSWGRSNLSKGSRPSTWPGHRRTRSRREQALEVNALRRDVGKSQPLFPNG